MSKAKRNKRSSREKYEGIQKILEERNKFDRDIISYGNNWTMPDETYKYHQSFWSRMETNFWRTMLAIFEPLFIRIAFSAKVYGKKNLKALKGKGAITICNHFHYLDTLFVRDAIGNFNSFHTIAPFNNKKGLGGHIIRHAGCLPFSTNVKAMKNFNNEIAYQLKRGKKVNFYPEQALWWNYQKPRPMKDGPFHYAVKFNVPILPIFCTFKKSKKGRLKKLKIHILPAIYLDSSLPYREQIARMKADCAKSWQECYNDAYNQSN